MPRSNAIPALIAALLSSFLTLQASAADPPVQPKKVVAFGDSMTVGLYDEGDDSCQSPNYGYPGRLTVRLENAGIPNEVANEGLCGEVTVDAVTRIDQALNRNADAKATIIMEGTNDLNNSGISVESMIFNINEMARKAQVRGAFPAVVAPPPRNPEPWGHNGRVSLLASRLAEEAVLNNYDFLDLFEVFDTIDPDFDTYYAEDGLHWNSAGYNVAAIEMVAPAEAALARVKPEPCMVDDFTLCLAGNRFKVQVDWKTPVPEAGQGMAEALTADTGFFWFFQRANIELVVKVLDARDINSHFWVFFGALSDVEYTITVTDTLTGRQRVYENPQGQLASVGDTMAFTEPPPSLTTTTNAVSTSRLRKNVRSDQDLRGRSPNLSERASARASYEGSPAGGLAAQGFFQQPARSVSSSTVSGSEVEPLAPAAATICVASSTIICLNEQRFAVQVKWTDPEGATGDGIGSNITGDTGKFYYFSSANIELVLKVLDGRPINGKFWVFFGSLSDVQFEVEVTDTLTSKKKIYKNPPATFASVSDVVAFEDEALPPPTVIQ